MVKKLQPKSDLEFFANTEKHSPAFKWHIEKPAASLSLLALSGLLLLGLPEGLVHVEDDDRVHHDHGRDRGAEEVPRRLDLVVVLEDHLDPEEGEEGEAEHEGRVEVQA